MSENVKIVEVPGWARPKGYANGAVGQGRVLHIAGQIGTEADGTIDDDDLIGQFALALDHVIAVVRAAGGRPQDVASMTVFVTKMERFRKSPQGLGEVWRERFGKHYPAMAVVGVTELYEQGAVVEIQAVAHLP